MLIVGINNGFFVFGIEFLKSPKLPFSVRSAIFHTILLKIYPDSILASVHPETVDFRMLGDFGTQTIGSDAHQKRIPGIPSTSIMRN